MTQTLRCTIIEIPDHLALSPAPTPSITEELRVDVITPEREFYGFFGRCPDSNDRKIMKEVIEIAKLLGMPPVRGGVL